MRSVPERVKKCYIALSLHCFVSVPVATRGEGVSRYKLPEPGDPEGGPGPDYVAYIFIFLGDIIICKMYKLTPSEQAKGSVQLRVRLFRFNTKVFSLSALVVGPENFSL